MIIIGIDPGTANTGFGVIKVTGTKKKRIIKQLCYGTIKTLAGEKQEKRLKKIYLEISRLLKKYSPDILAIERLYFFKNLKTAMPVSEARGVILLAAVKKNIEIKQFTPLQVKMMVCGYGRTEKKDLQKMVEKILKIKKPIRPDDAADALAIALCCLY
jgi:crossover junction endodeoxyribonuclease RuvC